MYAFDGIARAVKRAAWIGTYRDCTYSLWLRETAPLMPSGNNQGTLFGAIWISNRWLRCDLHADETFAESLDRLAFGMRNGTAQKIVSCDASAMSDGDFHHVAIVREGAEFSIYIDGVPQAITVGADTLLPTTPLSLTANLGLGAYSGFSGYSNYLQVDAGEFAFWTSPLSEAQIKRLAAGFSPRLADVLPDWYWRGLRTEEDIGGKTWTALYLNPVGPTHPRIAHADGVVDVALNPDRLGGYHVYCKAGTPATLGVDQPIRHVARDVDALALAVADLDLAPLTTYCVSVVAVNNQGLADPAHAWFQTNIYGVPVYLPSPVTGLRAEPLAGGAVRVSWSYAERMHGRQVAEDFLMEFERLDGEPDPDPIVISRPSLAGSFSQVLTLDEGQYRVRVLSRLGGLANRAVGWRPFITDATAPAEGLAGIEAN